MSTDRPRLRDAANLQAFRQESGGKARSGLLLHAGSSVEGSTDDVLAAPWSSVI